MKKETAFSELIFKIFILKSEKFFGIRNEFCLYPKPIWNIFWSSQWKQNLREPIQINQNTKLVERTCFWLDFLEISSLTFLRQVWFRWEKGKGTSGNKRMNRKHGKTQQKWGRKDRTLERLILDKIELRKAKDPTENTDRKGERDPISKI